MLRPMREQWEMAFVESGQAALQLLEQEEFDIIISDMLMPEMNGVELLDNVRSKYPHIIRLILSGHSEMALLQESTRAAHQFLSKPCEAEELKSAIDRALSLQQLLTNSELQTFTSSLESLPTLPSTYRELMKEVESPDSSLANIGVIIEKDIGMSAKILQLVNSSFFGISQHVEKPGTAVSLLGFDVIRGLILTTKIFESSNSKDVGKLKLDALWNHCLTVGTLSQKIAETLELDKHDCDYAFLAGILHDIGRVVIAQAHPHKYDQVIKDYEMGVSLVLAEQMVLSCDHEQVGAYLMGLWGLPNPVIEAIAFHHRPMKEHCGVVAPLTAVHIANVLVSKFREETTSIDFDRDYLHCLKIDPQTEIEAWKQLLEAV